MKYNSPEEVLSAFKQGNFVIVVCEDKEKEGDFFVLAEAITPEKVNFMLTHGKGMICVACAQEIIERFQLPPMVDNPADAFGTNFTVSVDAADGITTGVSASDRSTTIKIFADPKKSANFLVTPGHTHPLLARDPKLRWGHTECSVEMAKHAQKQPSVAICEILNKDGEKASQEELFQYAQDFNMPITSLSKMKNFLIGV